MRNYSTHWAIWKAVFKAEMEEHIAYRATVIVWALQDAMRILIYPIVWLAILASGTATEFSAEQFVTYYYGGFIVGVLVSVYGWHQMRIDIRDGTLSNWLVRPVRYLHTVVLSGISGRIFKLLIVMPLLICAGIVFRSYLLVPDAKAILLSSCAVILAAVAMHSVTHIMGMVTFWLEDSSSIMVLYFLLSLVLGGNVFPLDLLPQWIATIAFASPFRYFFSFPMEIWLELRTSKEILLGFMMLLGWMGVLHLISRYTWRAGVKKYSAVGM